ncbi:MAG TPA: hypothetical protein VE338_11035 [Ktedonobacterales bacterium]|nr:hypothetical protein [Ktedonobacterales bacterium]
MQTEHNTAERQWLAQSGGFAHNGRYAERGRWRAARERLARAALVTRNTVTSAARSAVRSQPLWVGALVMVAAGLLALAFYLNRPQPFIPFHDTGEYVRRADIILSGGAWVDAIRLPGYPLLLALLFAFVGKSNYGAAEALQYALFVATSVGVYALAYRITRHTRLAGVVGLLFGLNLYFLSYFRAILSDGLGALLIVGLALAVVLYLERPSGARFWVVAALCFAALITRGEWILAPIALFPYLLLVARRRGLARQLLAPMASALALIYGALGAYMTLNWRVNGYFGLTDATNINLYGKITQYGMQKQAPAHFAHITAVTEAFTRRGVIDPWSIYWRNGALAGAHFSHIGAYARAIILSHPVEYLARSAPVAFTSLYDAHVFGGYNQTGALAGFLTAAQAFSLVVYPLFMLFPVCAVVWLIGALRLHRRGIAGQALIQTEALGALSLLALYALAVTTLTTYSEYGRLHIAFDPLMLIVTLVSFAALLGALPLPLPLPLPPRAIKREAEAR